MLKPFTNAYVDLFVPKNEQFLASFIRDFGCWYHLVTKRMVYFELGHVVFHLFACFKRDFSSSSSVELFLWVPELVNSDKCSSNTSAVGMTLFELSVLFIALKVNYRVRCL